ncbi:hypothetical protein EON62_06550, partial [archaeon]
MYATYHGVLHHHALIIAEAVADICPSTSSSSDLARSWMEDRILSLRLTNLLKLLSSAPAAANLRGLNIDGDVAVFVRRLSSV